ncbi:MAG TPA: hypothetical protein VJ305_26195 [Streptosporangiaceae bacterium]|nr:hypothetical protein [Streptosporangiaceae bacterium]
MVRGLTNSRVASPDGQPVPGRPGYLGFLRGQLGRGLDRSPAGGFPDGARFAPGPLGESVHPHCLQHLVCGAELLAGVYRRRSRQPLTTMAT